MKLACILITDGRRAALVHEKILPALREEALDEILVVGAHEPGKGYRYLHVSALTNTTTDALVKRDVGTLACDADVLFYLCDDHVLRPGAAAALRRTAGWDVLVPSRWTVHPTDGLIQLNMGEGQAYCGGHGGAFRREVIVRHPWSCMPHHPLWDLYASHAQQHEGAQFRWEETVQIEDLEPEREPWR